MLRGSLTRREASCFPYPYAGRRLSARPAYCCRRSSDCCISCSWGISGSGRHVRSARPLRCARWQAGGERSRHPGDPAEGYW